MTSRKGQKKLLYKNKISLLIMIGVFSFVISTGIRAVYALYNNYASQGILANKIGDYDFVENGSGLIFYKEDGNGHFVRSYSIPSSIAYEFDDTLTRCNNTCHYSLTNEGYDCYYNFDLDNNRFVFSSNKEATCKLYFKELYDFEVNLSIMVENENGTEEYSYNDINSRYLEMFSIPAYGYEYIGYKCVNESNVEYDSESNSFVVNTTGKENCKVYFKEIEHTNVVTKVYIQKSIGSTVYEEVSSIPAGFKYKLSNDTTCYNSSNESVVTNDLILYDNGYLSINSNEPLNCTIKLDIVS